MKHIQLFENWDDDPQMKKMKDEFQQEMDELLETDPAFKAEYEAELKKSAPITAIECVSPTEKRNGFFIVRLLDHDLKVTWEKKVKSLQSEKEKQLYPEYKTASGGKDFSAVIKDASYMNGGVEKVKYRILLNVALRLRK